jgi:tRNA(Ile)-lysidine synthase
MLQTIKNFLKREWVQGAPILLTCSGGPDSKALMYGLVALQPFFKMDIQVVHVDHGWRKESQEEALSLKQEVERLGLKYYQTELHLLSKSEDEARRARYAFFQKVYTEVGAQGLMLAHQMEDQAETVLKRILEGASLPACKGMQQVSRKDQMVLWRPLLTCLKKELIAFLDERGIEYVVDPTNIDANYLRGRMRRSIIPGLEQAFGKSVVKNLALLGERVRQLEEQLDVAVLEHFIRKEKQGLSREEVKFLMKQIRTCTLNGKTLF